MDKEINGGGENSLKMKLYNLLKELSENEIAQLLLKASWAKPTCNVDLVDL